MPTSREFDREAFHEWYLQHGERLVAEVRRKLTERARIALAITSSDVAQSALVSFLQHDSEVDWKDPESVTYLMVGVAWRHAQKYSKRATRRDELNKQNPPMTGVLRDYEVTSDDNETRVDPIDVREKTKRLFYADCVAAFRSLGIDTSLAETAGDVLSMDPDGAALCRSLTPLELNVLACKIAGEGKRDERTQQITEVLQLQQPDLNVNEVRKAWNSVRRKAKWLDKPDDKPDDKGNTNNE